MQEHATAALIQRRMESLGFETFLCGGTGVFATLANGEGPVMHACGHDTHITSAIGAATLLAAARDTWL